MPDHPDSYRDSRHKREHLKVDTTSICFFLFYLLFLYLVPNSLMKICRQLVFTFCCLLLTLLTYSQKKYAFVSGKVLDENENPLSKVSVVILGRQSGIVTSDSGTFRLKVIANKAFAIQFSYTGYKVEQRNFLLNENEEEFITVKMERGATVLPGVTISNQHDRENAGLIQVNPK